VKCGLNGRSWNHNEAFASLAAIDLDQAGPRIAGSTTSS
jgi:hypothetical protein